VNRGVLKILLFKLTIILLLCNIGLYAQEQDLVYNFVPGTDKYSYVNSFTQDRTGAIWYGTQYDGLIRFNGYEFKQFLDSPFDAASIQDKTVYKVLFDNEDKVWVATDNGLCFYSLYKERICRFSLPDTNANIGTVWDLAQRRTDSSIWVATSSGLFQIQRDESSEKIGIHALLPPELNSQFINKIEWLDYSRLLICSFDWTAVYNTVNGNLTVVEIPTAQKDKITDIEINKVIHYNDSILWLVSRKKFLQKIHKELFEYNIRSDMVSNITHLITGNKLITDFNFDFDKSNGLLLSVGGKIYKFSATSDSYNRLNFSKQTSAHIYSSFVDNQETSWISTRAGLFVNNSKASVLVQASEINQSINFGVTYYKSFNGLLACRTDKDNGMTQLISLGNPEPYIHGILDTLRMVCYIEKLGGNIWVSQINYSMLTGGMMIRPDHSKLYQFDSDLKLKEIYTTDSEQFSGGVISCGVWIIRIGKLEFK